MDRMGLTDDELREYHRTLTRTHERRIRVEVQDLDGRTLSSLTPKVVDGQVLIDVTQIPTRILDLAFLDPSRSIHFEPQSPGDAPLHRSRQVQVSYSVRVPSLGRWVTCEVFTGPIWDFDRDGAVVSIVAHGKERQAMGAKWNPRQFPKKTRKTDIIKELMASTGEPCPAVPDLRYTTPQRFTVTRTDAVWPKVKRLARSMDRHLFYGGNGILHMRKSQSKPVFTFGDQHLLGDVQYDRDPDGVFNTFEVLGAKPKGSKTRVRAVTRLPDHHPLSSESLARNGKPLVLLQREVNPHLKTIAECNARAERLRRDAGQVLVNYQFDSIPVPHLHEFDLVRVRSADGNVWVPMRQWTLPLGWDGSPPMTVGALKRTMTVRRRKRGGGKGGHS